MSKDERIGRIMELRKEQLKIFSAVIGYRAIAMLKRLAIEYSLIGAESNAFYLEKRITHYEKSLACAS